MQCVVMSTARVVMNQVYHYLVSLVILQTPESEQAVIAAIAAALACGSAANDIAAVRGDQGKCVLKYAVTDPEEGAARAPQLARADSTAGDMKDRVGDREPESRYILQQASDGVCVFACCAPIPRCECTRMLVLYVCLCRSYGHLRMGC